MDAFDALDALGDAMDALEGSDGEGDDGEDAGGGGDGRGAGGGRGGAPEALVVDGEGVVGSVRAAEYLAVARDVLLGSGEAGDSSPSTSPPSPSPSSPSSSPSWEALAACSPVLAFSRTGCWWAARALRIHAMMLDDPLHPSETLRRQAIVCGAEACRRFCGEATCETVVLDPDDLGAMRSGRSGRSSRSARALVAAAAAMGTAVAEGAGPGEAGRAMDGEGATDGLVRMAEEEIYSDDEEEDDLLAQVWGSLRPPSAAEPLNPLGSACLLEQALLLHLYTPSSGNVRKALHASCRLGGLKAVLAGALGRRTRHQTSSAAQMVLLARSSALVGPGNGTQRRASGGVRIVGEDDASESQDVLKAGPLLDDPDEAVQLTAEGLDPAVDARGPLSELDKALVLMIAEHVKANRPASDELTLWELLPYVERVQQGSGEALGGSWVTAWMCLLMKSRLETQRGRTRERAMAQYEELAAMTRSADGGDGSPSARLPLFWASGMPPRHVVERELGDFQLRCGLVDSALVLFQRLGYWDGIIKCLMLLGKQIQAEHLVNQRLSSPDCDPVVERPRLLCHLGVLRGDPGLLEEAWECSGRRHADAMRLLGRHACGVKDWERGFDALDKALGLSPLNPEGWYLLGHCAMKLGRLEKAAQCYGRVCQQEPRNGEAWGNLAMLQHRLGRKKEAFVACKEALRHARDKWQLWENHLLFATQAESAKEVLQALAKIAELTRGDRLDAGALSWCVARLSGRARELRAERASAGIVVPEGVAHADVWPEGDAWGSTAAWCAAAAKSADGRPAAAEQFARDRATGEREHVRQEAQLRKLLDDLAEQTGASHPGFWRARAEFYEADGLLSSRQSPNDAFECRTRECRNALAGKDWPAMPGPFCTAARAAEALCEAACLVADETAARRLASARMQARSVLAQGEPRFGPDALLGGSGGPQGDEDEAACRAREEVAAAVALARGAFMRLTAALDRVRGAEASVHSAGTTTA